MKFDVTHLYKIPWDMFWVLMTGLAAGVLSFYFNRPEDETIKKFDVFIIVFSGVVGSVYIGNGMIEYMVWTGDFAQMMRFLIGLVSIQLIRGIVKLAQIFANNPMKLIALISKYLLNRDITSDSDDTKKDNGK